jgi:hypothetical protein
VVAKGLQAGIVKNKILDYHPVKQNEIAKKRLVYVK